MLARTEKEIRKFIEDVFDSECDSVYITDTSVRIEISKMYDYIDCSFSKLCEMSEFFDTKNIDIDEWSSRGCDTCDFGSSYTKIFDIS